MKAIAYEHSHPIDHAQALLDVELNKPQATGTDMLVKVKAVSVNPVDYKIRLNVDPQGQKKVLGWDAAGIVEQVGKDCSLFKVGDHVYYAGDLTRSGSNAQYQLVDERIVGRKPSSISHAQAAALPLTAITAWELLFDRLGIQAVNPRPVVLLIVGASGGVGSILTQLAAVLTDVTIIGTASRADSQKWARSLGAHHVIDHHQPLQAQVKALNIGEVSHVACLTHSEQHFGALVEILKPQGKLAIIEYTGQSMDISQLKNKSLSLHWEFMFTRAMFQTEDMLEQHNVLNQVADLVDKGAIKSTLGKHMGTINAQNLRAAHKVIQSNQTMGKMVLEGF
jgi:NADPH2:quinone reductase